MRLDITDPALTGKTILNIAIVAACPFPCARGTPVRVVRTAEALAELGHNVSVVTYHLGDNSISVDHERLQIFRIPRIAFYKKLAPGPTVTKLAVLDPLLLFQLFKIVNRQKIDIVYAHHYEALVVALLVRFVRRCTVVYDAHTMLKSELPDYVALAFKRPVQRFGGWLDKMLPRKADHVIAVSRQIADCLTENDIPESRLSIVGNGLELDHFMACPWFPKAKNRKKKVLIFTGSLAAYQGIEQMLRAFASLRSRRTDVILRIITNDDFQAYRTLLKELDVEGAVEVRASEFKYLPNELANACVAINPRISMDGVPQKLLNYMAVGVPVVSFAGSATHLVDGENGLVVPGEDVEMMAKSIERLLDDEVLAKKISDAARRDARRAGTWLSAARKIESVFASL